MEFEKYQHIERLGSDEVSGILDGEVYIFPKIDGTNGSIWYNGTLQYGSRRRHLVDDDNQGFKHHLSQNKSYELFFKEYPNVRLYGEFLVPHTIKTYRDTAWRKFYIFDVVEYKDNGEYRYMPYNEYKVILDKFKLDYIIPLKIITFPSLEQIYKCLEINDYLIKDGEGQGEGIVLKRYDYRNKYGRITWAKVVTSEFKEKHKRVMGVSEETGVEPIEYKIANSKCTVAFIEKTYAKVLALLRDKGVNFSGKTIPQLIDTTFHDFVTEEI
jgi:ATP-dependent RNA circularization protein (DNA/RNA ligase family)